MGSRSLAALDGSDRRVDRIGIRVEYESRSGLVALLHRLGLEYRKPEVIPRHLDETKPRAFIKLYEKLMNALGADEAVLFSHAWGARGGMLGG